MCIYVHYHITHTCSRHAAVLSDTSGSLSLSHALLEGVVCARTGGGGGQ